MKAVKFPQVNTNIAESQKDYHTLPAFVGQVGQKEHETGMIACMELDDDDFIKVLVNRKIWVRVLTFGQNLQPFTLQFDKDIFDKADDPLKFPKEEYHHNQDFHHVEVNPSFWQRLQMLFGYKLNVVIKSEVYGFQHSNVVTEHGVFTHKPEADKQKKN